MSDRIGSDRDVDLMSLAGKVMSNQLEKLETSALVAKSLIQASRIKYLLVKFCETVDAVGLVRETSGTSVPQGDEEGFGWSDLADVYLEACKVLGRDPVFAEEPPQTPSGSS